MLVNKFNILSKLCISFNTCTAPVFCFASSLMLPRFVNADHVQQCP